jgi:hypothetical protein
LFEAAKSNFDATKKLNVADGHSFNRIETKNETMKEKKLATLTRKEKKKENHKHK